MAFIKSLAWLWSIYTVLSVDSGRVRFTFRLLCATLPGFSSQAIPVVWPMGAVT